MNVIRYFVGDGVSQFTPIICNFIVLKLHAFSLDAASVLLYFPTTLTAINAVALTESVLFQVFVDAAIDTGQLLHAHLHPLIDVERTAFDLAHNTQIKQIPTKPNNKVITYIVARLNITEDYYLVTFLKYYLQYACRTIKQYSKSKMALELAIQVFTIAMVALAVHGCHPNNQISNFYSARAIFELSANESTSLSFSYQTYNLTLPHRYDRNSNLQYAFALSEAGALTGNLSYFDLLVLKTFEANLIINFIYEPSKWTRATYNYWITFRTDINLGVESFSTEQIAIKENGKYEVAYLMRQAVVPTKAAALVFLSGIRFNAANGSEGHRLSFVIGEQYVSERNQLVFSFTCNTTLSISSITFSYVTFDPHALPFGSYGGTVSSINLATIVFKDLRYILAASSAYYFFGVSSIQADFAFSLSSKIMDNLTLSYGVNQWEQVSLLQFTYVMIGQTPANVCLRNSDCLASGELYILGQSCVSSCPSSSRPLTHMDGAVECIPCQTNMVYSNVTKECICPSGFIKQFSGCVPQQQPNGVSYNRVSTGDTLGADSSNASPCLKIVGAQSNNKNLFITIQAGSQVLQDPQSSAKNYIQLKFGNYQASSYYCNTAEEDVTQYSCLALFTQGIPNYVYITASCTLSNSGSSCSDSYAFTANKNQ